MKKTVAQYKLLLLICTLFGGIFSFVAAQYYYFDTGSTDYPFQQGCNETLDIRANTESHPYGARAGLLRLLFDPLHFSYSTSSLASVLQTDLFLASTQTFMMYTNPSLSPGWVNTGATILQIDRFNPGSDYKGSNGLYGTLKFVPLYDISTYTGTFSMIYNGDTIKTSLSMVGGVNIIISGHQLSHLTGYYQVSQSPCVQDAVAPTVVINIPTGGTKKSHLSGISLTLNENGGSTDVPYIRTGGLPNIGIRTGNIWGITNQYGVNFNTFQIRISGNGDARYFSGGMFSITGGLSSVANGITWQFRDKNYAVDITGSQLFDYGIEKIIAITGNVRDRNNNLRSFSLSINHPVGPRLIPGSAAPAGGDILITTTSPVQLGIADDRAGVHSGTIRITLQGIGGTTYGPYVFSGSDLNLLGVTGAANRPDYHIIISGHAEFPSSGIIQVSVYAEDMEGNVDTIGDYSFSTRPSCADLGCCDTIYVQTGNNPPFLYSGSYLSVSGGIDPSFTILGNTGIVDCGMRDQGLHIYKGVETNTGSAIDFGVFTLPNLILSGTNVRAVLSGKTLYLQRIYVPPITGGCIGACGGGGGGGEPFIKDDCQLPSDLACANDEGIDDSPSYYDHTCCAAHGAATGCDVSDSPYSDEINDAFQRAYNLNITNKCPISDARLDDGLLRKDLAKMMTMFTIQIVGIYPDTHKAGCDKFSDTDNLTDEMKFFTKTSCQLYLMGLHPNGKTPKPVFDPNDPVPRTEFGTVLSRLIYGDTYNVHTGEELIYKRYEKHLKALNRDGIMQKILNPFMLEKRARAILMLYRTDMQKLVEKYRLVAPAHNGALSLLENIW